MSGTRFWLDGAPTASLPLPDRGFDFGDGLFETLRICRGTPLLLDRHLQRLADGLQRLAIVAPINRVADQVHEVASQLRQAGQHEAAIRVTVVRGAGPRGYRPDPEAGFRTLIGATPLGDAQWPGRHAPATLCLADVRWSTQPYLAGLKHLNRLEQVLAADSARRCRTDEALMLDQEDRVVSVSAGNLYLYCGGVLLTPRLERCGIAGTVRAELLEKLAPALGIPTREANLGLEELATADAVLYSNSLVGFRSVATWGERHWADHSLADTLRQALAEAAL